jgi:hypothetical protein
MRQLDDDLKQLSLSKLIKSVMNGISTEGRWGWCGRQHQKMTNPLGVTSNASP